MGRNFFYFIAIVAMAFSSCNKAYDEISTTTKSTSTSTWSHDRDEDEAVSSDEEGNQIIVKLEAATLEVTPLEGSLTDLDSLVVSRSSWQEISRESNTREADSEIIAGSHLVDAIFITTTTVMYEDVKNLYTNTVKVTSEDAYFTIDGVKTSMKSADAYAMVSGDAQEVINNQTIQSITDYSSVFMASTLETQSSVWTLESLEEQELLLSEELSSSVEYYDNYGEITITIIKEYTTGRTETSTEVSKFFYSLTSPAGNEVEQSDFTLPSYTSATFSTPVLTGEKRSEGSFSFTEYNQSATTRFARQHVATIEKIVYSGELKNIEFFPSFEVSSESNSLEDMTSTESYDRKLYTHILSAKVGSQTLSSSAETIIKVKLVAEEEEEEEEDLEKEELSSSVEYFDNYGEITITIVKEYTTGRTETSTEVSKFFYSLSGPAGNEVEQSDFTLPSYTSATFSTPVLTGEKRSEGSFSFTEYNQSATTRFAQQHVATIEKVIYSGELKTLEFFPSFEVASEDNSLEDMTSTESFERKLYTHILSAKVGTQTLSSSAKTTIKVAVEEEEEEPEPTPDPEVEEPEVEIERTTPAWLGSPVKAYYTRVQANTGESFQDMVVFEYQNGVVLAPGGTVNLSLCYAYSSSVASANGVEKCNTGVTSAVWSGSKWVPAQIDIVSGVWYYSGTVDSHAVDSNNALVLGIGEEVTPIPTRQSSWVEDNVIFISYYQNNGSSKVTKSLY